MIYPVYIHPGDETHDHGITIPDFEGCFSSAEKYQDIPANVQEAVSLHFEKEVPSMPVPSDIALLEASGEYTGGVWMLVDVENQSETSKLKEAISLLYAVSARDEDHVNVAGHIVDDPSYDRLSKDIINFLWENDV